MCRNKERNKKMCGKLSVRGVTAFLFLTPTVCLPPPGPFIEPKEEYVLLFSPSGSAAVGGSVTIFAEKTSSLAGARSSCRCSFVGFPLAQFPLF